MWMEFATRRPPCSKKSPADSFLCVVTSWETSLTSVVPFRVSSVTIRPARVQDTAVSPCPPPGLLRLPTHVACSFRGHGISSEARHAFFETDHGILSSCHCPIRCCCWHRPCGGTGHWTDDTMALLRAAGPASCNTDGAGHPWRVAGPWWAEGGGGGEGRRARTWTPGEARLDAIIIELHVHEEDGMRLASYKTIHALLFRVTTDDCSPSPRPKIRNFQYILSAFRHRRMPFVPEAHLVLFFFSWAPGNHTQNPTTTAPRPRTPKTRSRYSLLCPLTAGRY